MHLTELRQLFLDFCGTSRFRKFVSALIKRGDDPPQFDRLRYWQETLWNQFLIQRESAPTDVNIIGAALHWCDLHDETLVIGPGYQPNRLKRSEEFENARRESFPHGFGSINYHCPQCKQAFHEWVLSHAEKCSMLLRKIAWKDWLAAHLDNPNHIQAIRAGRNAMENFVPGDEIWEWDNGRGITGLAIVRESQIKTLWVSPISGRDATDQRTNPHVNDR